MRLARLPAVPSRQTGTPWDAASLHRLAATTFAGDQIIVVSQREPYSHEWIEGRVVLTRPASGMVTAVEPVLAACGGTWVADGSGSADRAMVDASDRVLEPASSAYSLRRVWLSAADRKGHSDGFSNSGLWPLCHMVHVRPDFRQDDWAAYRSVNARFADAVVAEARCADPIVLVQDYQCALVPAMVRARLPHATIVSFWHIPWAHPEQMGICPWLPELLEGLLASDIVGLQTPLHRRNFLATVRHALPTAELVDDAAELESPAHEVSEGRPSLAASKLSWRGHVTRVRDYPISVAWPGTRKGPLPPVAPRGARVPPCDPHTRPRLVVGIDRFDYTKGLIERLTAIERLLETRPEWRGRMRFIQVAAPTRTALAEYARFRDLVQAQVGRINARFAVDGMEPVSLRDWHHDRDSVDRLYRAADVCLVTSLHDGMNLVCKEFVAARDDERGVLVLSRFAGAADELPEALIVNPYHTEQVADALHQGLSMSVFEQRRRMRALRRTVRHANVHRWAADQLLDLREVRAEQFVDVEPLAERIAS